MARKTRDPKEQLIPPGRGVRVGGRKPKGKPPKPAAPGRAPRVPRAPRPTPDPLAGIFGPYESFINAQMAKDQAEAAARSQHTRNLWEGYAQYYGQNAPRQVQGIYQDAANTQSAFGKGFSETMAQIQQQEASQANQTIQTAGGPAGQMIQPNSDMADVIYGLGGYFPASTLNQQGAAFGAAAALQAPALLAQGGRLAAAQDKEAGETRAEWQGKLTDLKAKKAEARLKLKDAKAKAEADARKEAEDMRYKWASLDLRAKQAILSDRRSAQRIYQAEKRLGLSASKESFSRWYKKQTLALSREKEARIAAGDTGVDGAGLLHPTTGLPMTNDEIKTAADDTIETIQDWKGSGDEIGHLLKSFSDSPIPVSIWAPIVKQRTGLNIFANKSRLARMPLRRLEAIAAAFGRPLDSIGIPEHLRVKPNRQELVNYILAKRGKADAAPSGGKGISLPLGTSPGGGSEFGYSDPEGAPDAQGNRHHAAKDWFAPGGSAVSAPEGGRIVEVKASRGNSGQIYGGVVKIQTPDGRVWVFRHIDPRGVRVGMRVRPGQKIATVTSWTGGSSHAHIELWRTLSGGYRYENMIDPMSFFSKYV